MKREENYKNESISISKTDENRKENGDNNFFYKKGKYFFSMLCNV